MGRKKKEPDKLAQDAAAALAAGMTYGKWKAMQSVQEKKEEEPLPPGRKICPWCNKPFEPPHLQRKYCCDKCKEEALREYHRKRHQRKKQEKILSKL